MPSKLNAQRIGQTFFLSSSKKTASDVQEKPSFSYADFRKSIENCISHLSEKESKQVLRELFTEYYQNKAFYDAVFQNPEKVSAVHQLVEEQLQNNISGEGEQTIQELFTPLYQNKATCDAMFQKSETVHPVAEEQLQNNSNTWQEGYTFGPVFPGKIGIASILLSLVSPVAAQGSSFMPLFVAHTGQAPGGTDLCSGSLLGCAQGYTTKGSAPYQAGNDSTYVRSLRVINSKDASSSAYLQLRDCFSPEAFGNLVVNTRNGRNTTSSLTPCTTSSMPWGGYSVDTQAYVPLEECTQLQQTVDSAVQNCKSTVDSLLKAGAIAGIVIGSLAGLVLIAGGCYCTYKNCTKKANSTNNDIESAALNPMLR